jgi:hypothetical protein
MAFQTDAYSLVPLLQLDSSAASMLLDASGEKAAVIFRAPKTGSLAKVHFRLGTVTTGQTLQASLQDVDTTTGQPDGTADQSGTVAVADTDDNTWKTVTFGSSRSVARGDWIACVIEFDSTAGSLNIQRNASAPLLMESYTAHFTSSWTLSTQQGIAAFEYDDGSFGVLPAVQPGNPSTLSINTGTTPDEAGIRFRLPYPVRCIGIAFCMAVGADCELVLYDSDGSTVLESVSVDANVQPSAAVRGTGYLFDSSVDLAANTYYRAVVKPTTGSSFTFRYLALNAASWRQQIPGGEDFEMTQRTDGGAWTETPTQRPFMSLIVEAFDDGAGSGGIKRHPGMTGGCPA